MKCAVPPLNYSTFYAGGSGLEQSLLTALRMAPFEVNALPGLQVNVLPPSAYHTTGEMQSERFQARVCQAACSF